MMCAYCHRWFLPWFAAALLCSALPPVAQVRSQTVRQLERHGDWSVFVDTGAPKQLCFAASQPASSEPKKSPRESVYLYVTAWPKDGVKAEVSVKLGYTGRKGSAATATVGSSAFRLFIAGDRAFIHDADQEAKLLEAMKKGTRLIFLATSERGTVTSDVYSLSGLPQALQALAAACR